MMMSRSYSVYMYIYANEYDATAQNQMALMHRATTLRLKNNAILDDFSLKVSKV